MSLELNNLWHLQGEQMYMRYMCCGFGVSMDFYWLASALTGLTGLLQVLMLHESLSWSSMFHR